MLASANARNRRAHDGNGHRHPLVTQGQGTGKLGGQPWDLLGPTFEVGGLVKARITIEGSGRKSTFRAEGVGEGRGDTFKNPVTGEDHLADVVLDTGFIWKKGKCGQGSFQASAAGISVAAEKRNWIYYQFDWSNAA